MKDRLILFFTKGDPFSCKLFKLLSVETTSKLELNYWRKKFMRITNIRYYC